MLKNEMLHYPVLWKEVLEFLKPETGKTFIDCTFGAGGHAKLLLENGVTVYAIDRDINNSKFANELQEIYPKNLIFINDLFSNIDIILEKYNIRKINGKISK